MTTKRIETHMEIRSDSANQAQDLDRLWSTMKDDVKDMMGANSPSTSTSKTSKTTQETTTWKETTSTSSSADEPFKVSVPVAGYKAEDLSVKVVGDRLVVEAEREEKKEDNKVIVHKWKKSFILPKSSDLDALTCTLSVDGAELTISGPSFYK